MVFLLLLPIPRTSCLTRLCAQTFQRRVNLGASKRTSPAHELLWALRAIHVKAGVGGAARGAEEVEVDEAVRIRGRIWGVRSGVDKRARNEANQEAAKRRKLDGNGEDPEAPIYAVSFSKEEIENDQRKPKRKVAVMIGYSGSGYKGMQLNHHEKTIEGDLFGAFVAAGAISKANADDPKKSALIRCARTDKGVHAAGNVISLKLIIEDPDIVRKINDNLSPQIRVWGFERTNSSFSAYQFCDSRIYEYLIPTHAFLPPHPDSFLGRTLEKIAEEAEDFEGYKQRQLEGLSFWSETEEQYIKPILGTLDPSIRPLVLKALYDADTEPVSKEEPTKEPDVGAETAVNGVPDGGREAQSLAVDGVPPQQGLDANALAMQSDNKEMLPLDKATDSEEVSQPIPKPREPSSLDLAVKQLKAAYISAKKAYRIHPARAARIQSALSHYLGTHNYHNYTIQKSYGDPSAKRVIKSFLMNATPIIINNTEWLSLKVHGQSFMMHQIRKMVSMVALVVRCGCPDSRVLDTYREDKVSIPKAPGLGLLLERPVFDTYNQRLVTEYGREKIEFTKFEKEMEEFKQREIYERIFREEERDHHFHTFFASIDNFKSAQLLYLTSMGVPATKRDMATGLAGATDADAAIGDPSSDDDAEPEDG
ncbi:Pseudouridine synthase, catalytic domain [Lasallia pustulata]|uniref:tRNA pseudouridine synthase 1 n=1 Tax=Lasallia pustulata TaxID=136370 RepID=A0A1W5D885_9LECA|nr:Pseudouridine synthase, catalytic domain [Lasallia pustulata]